MDITARFHETCDSCSSAFLRSVNIPSYSARFIFEDDIKKEDTENAEEVVFFIDSKSETINIEDMVVQAILLNDPFVKRCEACTKRLDAEGDDEDTYEDALSKGNVIFS